MALKTGSGVGSPSENHMHRFCSRRCFKKKIYLFMCSNFTSRSLILPFPQKAGMQKHQVTDAL